LGKDLFYEIGDKLFENKEKIEELLFHQQETLFTPKDHTIFLYDLTNTHLEGSGLGNKLAARGRAKNKRTDCPLITLSLIVRNDGTPVASHIYKGSQSEPETMTDMLDRLEKLLGYDSGQMVLTKPTIIMDRGIATKDNIALLQERFYQYIVVTREDQTDDYLEEFKTAKETFLRIDDLSHKYTAYGDESHVYVKKIEPSGENICKILCLSDGKSHKENAIAAKKDMRYLVDIENLNRSIQKGSIKNIEKIEAKLNGHNEKHKIAAKKYNTVLLLDEAGRAQRVEITAKDTEPDPLSGCYVIESTHKELDAEKTWRLYMTQTRVEDAFRSLKDELGVRPIYHHNEVRTCAHLFITVLAYHILSVTERRLALHNDTRQWKTLRDVLSTHTRVTVVMRDKDDNIYHHRVTSKPEDVHQDIYKKLEIKDPTKNVVSCFK
jgi:transposase